MDSLSDIEVIRSKYRKGESLRSIARDYGVSHETIRQRLIAVGAIPCTIHPKERQIVGLYVQPGYGLKRVACELNVSVESIRAALEGNAIPLRKGGRPRRNEATHATA